MNKFKLIWFIQIIRSDYVIAAHKGHKDIVECLASKGANIHENDNKGFTALMIGIYYFDE